MFVRNGERLGSIIREPSRAAAKDAPAPSSEPKAPAKPPTKSELIAEAEYLGLSTEGTKAELEARIAQAQAVEEVSTDGDDDVHG